MQINSSNIGCRINGEENACLESILTINPIKIDGINYNEVNTSLIVTTRKEYLKNYLNSLLTLMNQFGEFGLYDENGVPRPFVCLSCKFRFCNLNELDGHVKRATCRLIFRCQLCFLIFETTNYCQLIYHCFNNHINKDGNYPKKLPIELLQAGSLTEILTIEETCPECRKVVGSIIAHLWCSPPSRPVLQCPYCYQFVTRNECRYNLHIKLHNLELPPFRCPDCAKLCKTHPQLNQHMTEICMHQEQTSRFKCSICGLIVYNNKALLNHIFSLHSPIKHKCTLCSEKLNTVTERNTHYTETHLSELTPDGFRRTKNSLIHTCPLCKECNIKGVSYERHILNHLIGPDFKIPYFMCKCGFFTLFKGIYITHRSTPCLSRNLTALVNCCAEMKECNNCFELRIYNGVEPFFCNICEIFDEITELPFYKCLLCFKFIKFSMNYVYIHLIKNHNLKDLENPYNYIEKVLKEISESNDSEVDSYCSTTTIKSVFKDHIPEESLKKCDKCSTYFTYSNQFNINKKTSQCDESKEKIYCNKCESSKSTELQQQTSDGLNENKQLSDLNEISNQCSNDNEISLKCNVCNETFNNTSEYQKHLRSHGIAFLKTINQAL